MYRASIAEEYRALSMAVGMLVYMRVLWTENAKFLMNLLLSHPLRRGVTSSDLKHPCNCHCKCGSNGVNNIHEPDARPPTLL